MTLDVAFLGYGMMGTAHANALARLPMFFPEAPTVERAVLIGRNEHSLEQAADRLGFDRTVTDWQEAIEAVDVLYNLGPNSTHPEPSIQALRAGVDVLCEKPLATDLESARRMARVASDSSAMAGVGFNYRYVPAIQYARDLIASGELGEIRSFRGQYLQDWMLDPSVPWSWRADAEQSGPGALGDLGSHVVDLGRYLVGEVKRATGQRHTFVETRPTQDGEEHRRVKNDDATVAQLAFENGATGTVEVSRATPGHKNDLQIAIHGSEGSVRFSLERLNELSVSLAGTRGYERVLVTEETDPYVDHWWPPGHVLGWEHTFVHQSYEFLSAVAEDRPYRPSFADGRDTQAILDAIERGDESGQFQQVG